MYLPPRSCLVSLLVLAFGLLGCAAADSQEKMPPIASERSTALAAVEQLGLTELAATFDRAKVARCSAGKALPRQISLDWQAQALFQCLPLAAMETEQTLTQQWHAHPVLGQLYDPGDPDWLAADHVIIEAFESQLIAVMAAGLSTGYNILPHNLWPNFNPEATVIYGHSNWQHVRQLVALLYTENLTPQVSLVLKKSAFLYREGWGAPTSTLITLANGQKAVDQVEFDLFLQFSSSSEIAQFAQLITRYAKKDDVDEPGLIFASWWQPFYRSLRPHPGAQRLTVLLVSHKGYRANLVGLPEQVRERVAAVQRFNPAWQISTYDIWVNPGFYRNQFGRFK